MSTSIRRNKNNVLSFKDILKKLKLDPPRFPLSKKNSFSFFVFQVFPLPSYIFSGSSQPKRAETLPALAFEEPCTHNNIYIYINIFIFIQARILYLHLLVLIYVSGFSPTTSHLELVSACFQELILNNDHTLGGVITETP